jgi:hypothetical protein
MDTGSLPNAIRGLERVFSIHGRRQPIWIALGQSGDQCLAMRARKVEQTPSAHVSLQETDGFTPGLQGDKRLCFAYLKQGQFPRAKTGHCLYAPN